MSSFGKKPPRKGGGGKVVPFPARRSRQIIEPHVSMEDAVKDFPRFLEKLAANDGQVRAVLVAAGVVPKGAGLIERVTCAHREDSSIAFIELRFAREPTPDDARSKMYVIVFAADLSLSNDPHHDGPNGLSSTWNALVDGRELLVPLNAPQLHAALDAYRDQKAARPLILYCEGGKAAEATAARIARNRDLFTGCVPVVSAWLCGKAGARKTNFALRPGDDADPRYIAPGKNARRLDLAYCRVGIVVDADADGDDEGEIVANRMRDEYGVPLDDITIIPVPPGAPEHWDDADPLPPGMTDAERALMYLHGTPFKDFWEYTTTRGGLRRKDPESIKNRQLIMNDVGFTEAYVDSSDNQYRFSYGNKKNKRLSKEEIYDIALIALRKMGHSPKARLMANWREPIEAKARQYVRDTIHEEIMASIERGQDRKNDGNRPEYLFIRSFNLPDTPYNREAGRHFIRDYLAVTLRPAFHADPVILQCYYVLRGNEGIGKSTWARVMAGAAPTGVTPRSTDKVMLGDLSPSASHGDLLLYLKLAGVTVCELADKALGNNISQFRADVLKSSINRGRFEYRRMYGDDIIACNVRCLTIFTTNYDEILSAAMGERRWVILDLSKSQWPGREEILARGGEPTAEEEELLAGRNPGLHWLYENRDAMLAHMYDDGAWRGDLSIQGGMREMMPEVQESFRSPEAWTDRLADALGDLQGYIRSLDVGDLLSLNEAQKNEGAYRTRLGRAMKEIGFKKPDKYKKKRFGGEYSERYYFRGNEEQRIYVLETFEGSRKYYATTDVRPGDEDETPF